MPMSRHARWIRRAISPRLAIRIFSNMIRWAAFQPLIWGTVGAPGYLPFLIPTVLADHHQGFAVFDRLTVLDHDRLDHAVLVGLDFVHQLHRLDDADGLSRLDRISDLDERLCAGGTRPVESANHRRLDDMPFE